MDPTFLISLLSFLELLQQLIPQLQVSAERDLLPKPIKLLFLVLLPSLILRRQALLHLLQITSCQREYNPLPNHNPRSLQFHPLALLLDFLMQLLRLQHRISLP